LPNLKTPTSFFGPSIWLDTTNYPQQKIQNPAGGGKIPAGDLIFQDEPFVTYNQVPKDGSSINFDLYLVTFTWNGQGGRDAGGTVTILDGMQWGVQINAVPEPSALALAGPDSSSCWPSPHVGGPGRIAGPFAGESRHEPVIRARRWRRP